MNSVVRRYTYLELEEKLASTQSELATLAYVVSHDFQEPLRTVSSYLQLLQEEISGTLNQDGQEYLSFTLQGAGRLREMQRSVLEYSRLSGSNLARFELVDLNIPIQNACHIHRDDIKRLHAKIEIETLPTVHGNPKLLTRLFDLLLDNSLKFSGNAPPHIVVRSEKRGTQWLITFEDNGVGIELKWATRVFQLFQRLHTTKEYPGNGSGLAIAKRIVTLHRGNISLLPKAQLGSILTFSIPCTIE